MNAEAPIASRSWSVGRYTCTLALPKLRQGGLKSVVVEWAPEQPQSLTDAEIEQYRAGRDAAIAELGLCALVVEV